MIIDVKAILTNKNGKVDFILKAKLSPMATPFFIGVNFINSNFDYANKITHTVNSKKMRHKWFSEPRVNLNDARDEIHQLTIYGNPLSRKKIVSILYLKWLWVSIKEL
jgi:hypothetical protein